MPKRRGSSLLRAALFLATYLLTARLLHGHAVFQQAIVWLPTGVAVTGLWLMGLRMWPVVALGTLLHRLSAGYAFPSYLVGMLGNTLEAVTAVALLKRFDFRPDFRRLQDVIAMVAAAVVAPFVSATIGRTAYLVQPDHLTFFEGWAGWWRMNALGILVVAPLALSWVALPRPRMRPRSVLEIAGLGAAVLLLIAFIVSTPGSRDQSGMVLSYLGLPLALYAAMRFGVRGAATASAGVVLLLTLGTVNGIGPFVSPMGPLGPSATHELALQAVVAIVTVTPLLMGAARTERESALRAAERERASRLDLIATINRNLNEGLFRSDSNRRVVFANNALAQMLGYANPEEIVGLPTDSLVADPAQLAEVRGRLESYGAVIDEELLVRRKDGDTVPALVRCTTVPGEDGAVEFFDGSVTDITARKRLEDRLHQVQKMEALGQLAGGVAHDFNNLLTAIGGYAAMLRDDLPAGSAHRRDADEILGATERAASLTRQLLAYSRGQRLDPQVADLGDIVVHMSGILRRLIGETVDLQVRRPATPAWVRVDRGQIERVLLNLALNARDAMPAGGTLTLGVSALDVAAAVVPEPDALPEGPYVSLVVHDNGLGMNAETLNRAFDPFYTTKEPGRGTGLGLSTVYGIVRQSGGRVRLESEPGCGTTVRVLLPRLAHGPEPVREPATPAHEPVSRCTILVAEDEANVRELVCRALREEGHEVIEAEDGQRALDRADRADHPVELLVTDVVMPRLSGTELAARLGERWPGLPVLFMSGYASEADQPEGGSAQHLQKPFTKSALLAAVRASLARRPSGPTHAPGSEKISPIT